MKSTHPRPRDILKFIIDFSVFFFVVFSVVVWFVFGYAFFGPHTRCPEGAKDTLFGCAKVVDGVVVYVDSFDPRTDEDRLIDQVGVIRIRFYGFSALGVGVVWVCVRRWV